MPPATRYSVMWSTLRLLNGRIRCVDAAFAGFDGFLTGGGLPALCPVDSAVWRTIYGTEDVAA